MQHIHFSRARRELRGLMRKCEKGDSFLIWRRDMPSTVMIGNEAYMKLAYPGGKVLFDLLADTPIMPEPVKPSFEYDIEYTNDTTTFPRITK